jgi:hypothetical protein
MCKKLMLVSVLVALGGAVPAQAALNDGLVAHFRQRQ